MVKKQRISYAILGPEALIRDMQKKRKSVKKSRKNKRSTHQRKRRSVKKSRKTKRSTHQRKRKSVKKSRKTKRSKTKKSTKRRSVQHRKRQKNRKKSRNYKWSSLDDIKSFGKQKIHNYLDPVGCRSLPNRITCVDRPHNVNQAGMCEWDDNKNPSWLDPYPIPKCVPKPLDVIEKEQAAQLQDNNSTSNTITSAEFTDLKEKMRTAEKNSYYYRLEQKLKEDGSENIYNNICVNQRTNEQQNCCTKKNITSENIEENITNKTNLYEVDKCQKTKFG